MSPLFIALAGLLTLATCAAIVLPLMRGGSERPRGIALGILLLVPLATLLLYLHFGRPDGLGVSGPAVMPAQAGNASEATANLEDAINGLRQRLQSEPDDIEGWRLLGRAYKALERFDEARDAVAQAHQLAPDNADVLVDLAETTALANPEHRFDEQAVGYLQQALAASPDHPRALWFAGVAAYQRGDNAQAASTWQSLRENLPPGADILPALTERIAEARRNAGLPPLPAVPDATTASSTSESAANDAPLLRLRVELDESLRDRVNDSDTVFVFARAINGPPMPLAVRRLTVAELPADIELGDTDSMLPNLTLSSQPHVTVVARVSFGGQPTAKPGDLESIPFDVAIIADADSIETQRLLIDTVHR
ncbi:MAG: tetratricopeptide repeat protein [Lysobacteraceae bacterium]